MWLVQGRPSDRGAHNFKALENGGSILLYCEYQPEALLQSGMVGTVLSRLRSRVSHHSTCPDISPNFQSLIAQLPTCHRLCWLCWLRWCLVMTSYLVSPQIVALRISQHFVHLTALLKYVQSQYDDHSETESHISNAYNTSELPNQ